jgi:hypothetical protein
MGMCSWYRSMCCWEVSWERAIKMSASAVKPGVKEEDGQYLKLCKHKMHGLEFGL